MTWRVDICQALLLGEDREKAVGLKVTGKSEIMGLAWNACKTPNDLLQCFQKGRNNLAGGVLRVSTQPTLNPLLLRGSQENKHSTDDESPPPSPAYV
jgi:hypothetical protein